MHDQDQSYACKGGTVKTASAIIFKMILLRSESNNFIAFKYRTTIFLIKSQLYPPDPYVYDAFPSQEIEKLCLRSITFNYHIHCCCPSFCLLLDCKWFEKTLPKEIYNNVRTEIITSN